MTYPIGRLASPEARAVAENTKPRMTLVAVGDGTEVREERQLLATDVVALTHGEIEAEIEAAYHHGYQSAIRDICSRAAELSEVDLMKGRLSREQRIERELQQMEECARRFHEKHGTKPFDMPKNSSTLVAGK